MADCSVCGSQDTTFKSGISKTGKNAGKPWRAWDCNEPQCKNEKGYPNRTFEFTGKPRVQGKPVQVPNGDFQGIHRKLDMILNALGVKTSLGGANDELQMLGDETTPF